MRTLLVVVAALVRLVLPARGAHAAPRGAADLVQAGPAPRTAPRVQADGAPAPRTTSRVRRYALPEVRSPYDPAVPWTPPVVDPENVNPQAAFVRPYYVAYERAGVAR